ncbi:replication protein RepA, partial [Solihabitans fulvus]
SLPRRAVDSSGLGRNVALFNRVRLWAYRARLRYEDRVEWEEVTFAYAVNVNAEFAVELPLAEVGHTARSVARWVWRNFSREKFSTIQASRGRITSEAKREANRKRATKVDLATALEAWG